MSDHDTEWLQGNVLTDKDAYSLGLVNSLQSDRRVVVISHDCDLANKNELKTEVIVGTVIETVNPMYGRARHPRYLHLIFLTSTGKETCIQLLHSDRIDVTRDKFSELKCADVSFILKPDEKRSLKQWLAARYGRPAFPNSFENRLRKQQGKKTIEYHIAKILEPASVHLIGVFFDLDEHRDSELPDDEPYILKISIVYDALEGGQLARVTADKTALDLTTLFHQVYGAPDITNEIALEACNAVADTFLTLADLRKVDQWRVEYISLREDPIGNFIAVGDVG
jgi:hypothetical protein